MKLNLTCWWYNNSLAGFSIRFYVAGKSFGKGGEGKNLRRRRNLAPVSEKFWNLGLLECIFSILEQKLECLNRTQTSLNFVCFLLLFSDNIQRKVGGKLREIASEFLQPPALIENPGWGKIASLPITT